MGATHRREEAADVLPDVELRRDEYGFLAVSAVVITTVAQLTDPGTPLDLLILSPAVAAFVLQQRLARFPVEVFAFAVLVPIFVVAGVRTVLEPTWFLSVTMVLYVAAHVDSTLRAAWITAVAAAMPWFVATVVVPEEDIGWQAWSLAHVFTFVLGRLLHRQQALIGELERARQALAEQAVAEERRRIARELHDLAGHTLAAVMLHVTGARHVLRRDPADAERALADAEAVGRASLDQIRATVAALRTEERGTDPAVATAADLDAVVDEYRRAGLDIDASIPAQVAALAGPVGTALHRITREALVNVARHAPGNTVEVRAEVQRGDVRLVIVDHGTPPASPDPNSGHFGLLGMGERARAVGGTLDAHATVDGWRVEARLPIPPAPSNELAVR